MGVGRVTEDKYCLCASMGEGRCSESMGSSVDGSDISLHTGSAKETVTVKDTGHYLRTHLSHLS